MSLTNTYKKYVRSTKTNMTKYNANDKRYHRKPTASSRKLALSLRGGINNSSNVTAAAKKIVNIGGTLAVRGWHNKGGELKYSDIAGSNVACDTTGFVTLLNGIAVGDDNTTRDGRQVVITSVHIRGIVFPEDQATGVNLARWLLVWDKAPNSSTDKPTIAQILTAGDNSLAMTNLDNRERFIILRDKQYPFGYQNNTATQAMNVGQNMYDINEYVKLNTITTYSGTVNTLGAIATGALWFVTTGTAAAGTATKVSFTSRIRYTDN